MMKNEKQLYTLCACLLALTVLLSFALPILTGCTEPAGPADTAAPDGTDPADGGTDDGNSATDAPGTDASNADTSGTGTDTDAGTEAETANPALEAVLKEAQAAFDAFRGEHDPYYDYTANPFTYVNEKEGIYVMSVGDTLEQVSKQQYTEATGASDPYAKYVANAVIDADVFCVPCVGQSLATNTDAGPSSFTELYPLSYNNKLKNENIQDMNTGFCEGFALMAERYGITLPENFKIITFVVGQGGTSINRFLKGTDYYKQVLSGIKTAKRACDKYDLKMVVPGFMWTQGEEDMRTGGTKEAYGSGEWNPFEYSDKFIRMTQDLGDDIRAITGQDNEVYCFSYQVASQNTYYRYPRIALEQLDAAGESDLIILAKTMYDVNYNESDFTHCPAATYRDMGNYYGMACFVRTVLGATPVYTHVIGVEEHGNEVVLSYEVPVKPLTLDTVLVDNLEDGNYGFCIYNMEDETATNHDGGGISLSQTVIQKVEIISPTQIKLTLSRPLEDGDILTYAVNGIGWGNVTGYNVLKTPDRSGPREGARGCVRDSTPIKNNNPGTTLHDMYSWMPIWEYRHAQN